MLANGLGYRIRCQEALDLTACDVLVQAIVQSLGMLSTESTANVSPALAQLQMLQTLSDAWPLRWAENGQAASSSASRSDVRLPLVPDDAALARLQTVCRRREAVTGRYPPSDLTLFRSHFLSQIGKEGFPNQPLRSWRDVILLSSFFSQCV